MIIFYEKETGKIVGNIEGRVHDESHMRMWIGDRDKTDRLVCEWEKDKDKGWQPKVSKDQESMVLSLDKKETKLKDYKVNVRTKKLEKGIK